MRYARAVCAIGATLGLGSVPVGGAADLIVSANDAKYLRVAGIDTYPADPGPDTLNVIDVSRIPAVVEATVPVEHSIAGPPQAVAITPNGRLAFVSAPSRYDPLTRQPVFENFLQVIDLGAAPPRVVGKIELGAHPQGLAVNPDGNLLLAASLDGTVAVLSIDGDQVVLRDQLKIADKRLAGISFSHDGSAALVAARDEQGLIVLNVEGTRVTTAGERITTGVAPYSVDVSSDGKWAVVSNVGLAGLDHRGRLVADADSCTLIDVSRRPFRAIQHFTVPSVPEGVAISPNGRWIAVQAMAGSNLTPDNPGYRPRGRVVLFRIRDGQAVKMGDLPGGQAAQGIVFSADSRRVYVQFNVEKQIATYAIDHGVFKDTGERIPMTGGPASLRSMPR